MCRRNVDVIQRVRGGICNLRGEIRRALSLDRKVPWLEEYGFYDQQSHDDEREKLYNTHQRCNIHHYSPDFHAAAKFVWC